jgi:hypothetical protein
MSVPAPAVYRIRRYQAQGKRAAGYQRSFEVSEEQTGQVLASCDVMGRAAFTALVIVDHDGGTWLTSPNRKVMPSRWAVTDPGGNTVVQLDAKIAGKLLNPLYRTSLAVLDAHGNERCRLLDPRSSTADRILGTGPGEWAFVSGEDVVARLVMLPKQGDPPAGLLGRIARLFADSDRGLVSLGPDHILPAPAVLAIAAIHDELTNMSGA